MGRNTLSFKTRWLIESFVLWALMLIVLWFVTGCGARPPCMTGFELGVNGGTSQGIIREYNTHYGGVHATLYYDTTGSCGPFEE